VIRVFGELFDPDTRGLSVVTIDGGVVTAIEAVTPGQAVPMGEPVAPDVLGGPRSRIVPGLIDAQINGAFGQDFADPDADLALACSGLPRFGVTAFVPTIVSSAADVYGPALASLRRDSVAGEARVLGVHLEGPFMSPQHAGTHDPGQLRPPSIAEATAWLEAGDVRYVTLAPELPGSIDLIEFLVGRGVRVALGHSGADWAACEAAERAGATLVTHVFNAMGPLRHRDPGLVGYALASQLTAGFIADGNHLAFDTIRLLARIKAPDELMLVTDALAGLGMPPGRYSLGDQEYVSDGASGRRDDGTLSGSLLPLNLALRNLVEEAGVEPATAIRFATLNPARALGLEPAAGRVVVGGRADLAVLDERWDVEATVAGGALAYLRERVAS
jgi:N-acetylglucosamine-6-phosphate deacetylase